MIFMGFLPFFRVELFGLGACGRSSQRALALELLREAVGRSLANQVGCGDVPRGCGGRGCWIGAITKNHETKRGKTPDIFFFCVGQFSRNRYRCWFF